jgi:hypothetical protein
MTEAGDPKAPEAIPRVAHRAHRLIHDGPTDREIVEFDRREGPLGRRVGRPQGPNGHDGGRRSDR